MKFKILLILLIAAVAGVSAAEVPAGSTKAERNFIVRGNALYNDSNYHAALEQYEHALALNPTSVYALYNKAVTLVQLATDDNKGTENDPRQKAREIFENIAKDKVYPQLSANSAYNLGNMAYNDGDFGSAIKWYKESLRIIPDNVKARQNLLLALQQQENQDQNQDQQDQQDQQEEQQQQQQEQQQQQQQPQEQQMSQSAQQLMQAVQNKENATRRREQTAQPATPYTDKPW